MWINTIAYKTLLSAWNEQVTTLANELRDFKVMYTAARHSLIVAQGDNNTLRQRLIAAEGDAKSAQAMRDLLVIQNSQLQEERGQFLQKLLDPTFRPTIRIPKISHGPTLQPSGIDFEDMGDTQAAHEGYSDVIPVDQGEHLEEAITGLSGVAYDPASELGAALPRLGDDPGSAPDM